MYEEVKKSRFCDGEVIKRSHSIDSQTSYGSPTRPHSQIKKWAKNIDLLTDDEMIEEFEKNKYSWISEKYKSINVEEMIVRLTRYKRLCVLKYIIKYISETDSSVAKQLIKSSPPLNEMVWIGDDDINMYGSVDCMYERIIEIFSVLMELGFNFMKIKEYGEGNEIFLDSLLLEKNNLGEEIRNRLYLFFTTEWYDQDKFSKSIKTISGKISSATMNKYKDRGLFLISRNIFSMTHELFMAMLDYPVGVDSVKTITNMILENPSDGCFNRYFMNIDINLLRINVCDLLIDNFEQWINDMTDTKISNNSLKNESLQSEEDLRKDIANDMRCQLYYIMTIFYNSGYVSKEKIIDELFTKREIEYVNIYKIFLKNINSFDEYTLEDLPHETEHCKLLVYFIENFYFSDKIISIKSKMSVEFIISGIFNIDKKYNSKVKGMMINFLERYHQLIPKISTSIATAKESGKLYESDKTCATNINIDDLDEFYELDEIEQNYCKKFKNYYNNLKRVTLEQIKENPKLVTEHLEDIKLDIIENEMTQVHKKQLIYGLISSFEEIKEKDCIVIKLLIKFINNNVIKNFINDLHNEFVTNENKINNIFDCFDNPMLKKIVENIKKEMEKYISSHPL
jgi:hypothetical protein